MSDAIKYEEAKKVAERDGVWPDVREVDDCGGCPFARRDRDGQADGCSAETMLWRKFTDAELGELDGRGIAPEWCPIRIGSIRVRLATR